VVAEDFIVIHDGISGANFSTRQLLALVQAARSTPRPFDALVVNALDRVGREQFRTNAAFLDLIEAGVKVYLLDDGGQELRLDTPIAKAMVAFRSYAAEDFRHQIQIKTRQAMHNKARKGHVAGSKIYGY